MHAEGGVLAVTPLLTLCVPFPSLRAVPSPPNVNAAASVSVVVTDANGAADMVAATYSLDGGAAKAATIAAKNSTAVDVTAVGTVVNSDGWHNITFTVTDAYGFRCTTSGAKYLVANAVPTCGTATIGE